MKNLSLLLFILTFFFFSGIVLAEEEKALPERNFANYVNIGVSGLTDFQDFNQAISGNNYQAFNPWFISAGTGVRIISEKFVFGSEANFVLDHKNLNQDRIKSYFSYTGNISAKAGYVIFSSGNFRIYPLIGGGIGYLRTDFYEDHQSLSFQEILSNPRRGASLSSMGLLADLGIGFDYAPNVGRYEVKHSGLMFGLRAGYIFTVYETPFSIRDITIKDSPSISFNGPYLRLMVGISGNIFNTLLEFLN